MTGKEAIRHVEAIGTYCSLTACSKCELRVVDTKNRKQCIFSYMANPYSWGDMLSDNEEDV